MNKIILLVVAIVFFNTQVFSQKLKRVLFIGNSYTYYSNLPKMVADMATSTNDTLIYDSNTPGGYTLQEHSTDTASINRIKKGKWDFVSLQEQSQRPALPISEVQLNTFKYARILDSIINVFNPCSETIFYMTWGRKFGDADYCASVPLMCTYQGMDSLLRLRYTTMAESNKAIISPVSVVWKYMRENYPSIELYDADNSHPSLSGTYLAACCFYTAIFRKNPLLITYTNAVPLADALKIKQAVKKIMFDSLLAWKIGEFDVNANFSFTKTGTNIFQFKNVSKNAIDFKWIFGDGSTSTEGSPNHTYTTGGNYTVKLIASNCSFADTFSLSFSATTALPSFIKMYPNPVFNKLIVNTSLVQKIEMVNAAGKTIIPVYKTDGQNTFIDFATLSTGIYFVTITANGQSVTQKILKR
jgi:Secretion system C-terminal sorting domain/PKD domain